VNAVPPLGIDGLDLNANGSALGDRGALGVGALAIGNVKYRTEAGLFKQMAASASPLKLDFRQAFELARTFA
jgi:methylene-tetrahydromethanopterin dehydrogenase